MRRLTLWTAQALFLALAGMAAGDDLVICGNASGPCDEASACPATYLERFATTEGALCGCPPLPPSQINMRICTKADGPMQFFAVSQCRAYDTREDDKGEPIAAWDLPTFNLWAIPQAPPGGTPRCPASLVPSTARAVALNITVVNPTLPGHLSVAPTATHYYPYYGEPEAEAVLGFQFRPGASTLNFGASQTIANGAVVDLNPRTGNIEVQAVMSTGGSYHLIIDVAGYYQ